MIGAIPNPQKKFQIDRTTAETKFAIEHIYLYTSNYKLYKSNELLGIYTFESYEFLSLGVYIDVTINALSENRTDITIEIRRKIGSFDKSHEITLANDHIVNISDLISHSLMTNPESILQQREIERKKQSELSKQKIQQQAEWIERNPNLYKLKIASVIATTVLVFSILGWMIYRIIQ